MIQSQQAMNSISLYIADKRELTHFLYAGGIVPKSRQFCIAHANQIFSREDAKDSMIWNGGQNTKVLIFDSCGGYNCFHHIQWLPNE